MHISRTNLAPTVRPDSDQNSSGEDADVIFISDWARRYSAKEGAKLTGMTPNGFKKIQSGDNAISYAKLTHWLKSDADLAAAYAEHVGLIRPGEGEYAGALTRAFNAHVRRKYGGPLIGGKG